MEKLPESSIGQHTFIGYSDAEPYARCACGLTWDDELPEGENGQPSPCRARCAQCHRDMGYEWILGPVCGKCVRLNHRKAVGA